MLLFPGCKINIGLFITNRRSDGYHELETIFYPLDLHDVLEVVPAKDKTSLSVSGKKIPGDMESNLVWKAYHLLKKDFGDAVPELDIYLNKTLPMGAGLGGGSADGSYMLRLVNDYCKLGLNDEQLAAYALQLGSDCPFFIYNTPQFAKGRGEKMQPINIDLSPYSIQLICPQVHVPTAKAFSLVVPCDAPYDLRKLPQLPVEQWKYYISNDFETPIFSIHTALAEIKDQLYKAGAIYVSMSGSGSSIYAIFKKGEKAAEIKARVFYESFYIE